MGGKDVPTGGSGQELVCLACGTPLEAPLALGGSLRCSDCRDGDAPLDPEIVNLGYEG